MSVFEYSCGVRIGIHVGGCRCRGVRCEGCRCMCVVVGMCMWVWLWGGYRRVWACVGVDVHVGVKGTGLNWGVRDVLSGP